MNSVCTHRNKTYISGFFNRIGDERAQHFVVLDETLRVDFVGVVGIETTLERILESSAVDSDEDEDGDSSAAKSSTVTRWVHDLRSIHCGLNSNPLSSPSPQLPKCIIHWPRQHSGLPI